MSDDEYPNFGSAWTATTPSASPATTLAPSWNPALRPNTTESRHARNTSTASVEEFFDRYPGPTPEKGRAIHHEPVQEEDEEDRGDEEESPDTPARHRSISVRHAIDQRSETGSPQVHSRSSIVSDAEGPMTRRDSADTGPGIPAAYETRQDDANDEEAAIFHPHETLQEQADDLEDNMPLPPATTEDKSAERAGDGYEHQGETLEMEEAIEEAPTAPLMMDPEEVPTVETLQREPSMRVISEKSAMSFHDVAEAGQSLPVSRDQPEPVQRTFTTNFTEIPTPLEAERDESQEPSAPSSEGWPSAGDDKTFGELLGDELPSMEETPAHPTQDSQMKPANHGWADTTDDNTFGELLGEDREDATLPVVPQLAPNADAMANTAEGGPDEDLAAMWGAALDDDDLLDESNDLDPATLFGDDDPGFLEDEPEPAAAYLPVEAQRHQGQTQRASSYIPASAQRPARPSPLVNQYAVSTPQISGQEHARSVSTPSTGLYDVYAHGAVAPQQQASQRPALQSAQSFVDKSKGGYQSPYDLPMEVVSRARQRPRPAPTVPQAGPTPPPRSTSMSSQLVHAPPLSGPHMSAAGADLTPPPSAGSVPGAPPPTAANGNALARSTPKMDPGFFEELPVSSKARSRLSYTPQPGPTASTQSPSHHPARGPMPPTVQQRSVAPPPVQQQPSLYGGLTRQPERLPLLPDLPTASSQSQPPSGSSQAQRHSPNGMHVPTQSQSRFSPAPPAQGQSAASRYSPAPTSQIGQAKKYSPSAAPAVQTPPPPSIQQAHAFAPRTSSPLAFQTDKTQPTPSSPPKTNRTRSSGTMSPERASNLSYSPIDQRATELMSVPQRPMTHSPPELMKAPKYTMYRPDGSSSVPATSASPAPASNVLHRRQFSKDFNLAPPNDERVQDPLERWQGCPVFKWGGSGVVLSSFPKHMPFYAAGGGSSTKCMPGMITVQQATAFMPMNGRNAKFPGPLAARAKGRKKEVLTWMIGKLEDLEKRAELVRMDYQVDLEFKKRTEEKVMLWKIVKIFVEHDGRLEGDKKIEDEVRAVLVPDLAEMSQVMDLQSPISTSSGMQADAIDKNIIIQLRQALLEGQRERAVWLAEEKKLWGHAMLIASTMGAETWKQIVQSFVRSQVKTVGSDARSLAALYQVFAGNAEECADELVPPSARAGFQMVSKLDGARSGNPLEGLDQWRETLGLVTGNRTSADAQSLLALGKLLSGYGRAEAAHICFLFARQLAKHTGSDDPEANFVILGANHQSQAGSFADDSDAIILTEIYEWASSLSAPSTAVHYIPHLQSFKLLHARELAAYGLKKEAQSYCDHITAAYTSTTRPSPYYHPIFTQSVTDLSAFLSQTPQAGPSGLLAKGAMTKVSSGAASWFTKFVSGDDDQQSNSSGPGAGSDDVVSGPFGRINGDSPSLSRTGSTTDLYNPMMGGGPYAQAPFTPPQHQSTTSLGSSKYAPTAGGNRYAPTSVDHAASQRPMSNYSPAQHVNSSGAYRPDVARAATEHSGLHLPGSRPGSAQYPGSQASYEPRPQFSEDVSAYGYQATVAGEDHALAAPNSIEQANNLDIRDAEVGGYQPQTGGYEPPVGGYEPPGYEQPSYQPYEPEPDAQEEDDLASKPKKSFMDDDEDENLAKRAAAMQKAEADRQADDAFRKAAEADANRDNAKGGEKKGWLGGWLRGGGKKEQQNMPTVHKAKLGEENSFYYDEDLKKWVNKKGGPEAATPAAAAPPPPRGPPGRTVSSSTGPTSGPPSRGPSGGGPPHSARNSLSGSPSMGPPSGPSSRSGTPFGDGPPMPAAVTALSGSDSKPPSAPPSRPPTSMSNASDLDDLLGGPPGGSRRVGGTVKGKKKGGRYVDVMQK